MKHPALQSGNCISHLPFRHRGNGRYYALAFIVWLLASCMALAFVLRTSIEQSESEFREYSAGIHTHLRDKLRANEAVLYGFAGFLGAIGVNSNDSARSSTRIYAGSLLERYPHIHSLEIVRKLARREVESYTAQLQRTVLPDFRVRQFNDDGHAHALPEKDFYYPVVFMAPELPEAVGNYGLDIDSQDGLKHALLRSEREGVPVSSEPFRLLEGEVAYVMFRPAISFAAPGQGSKNPSASVSYALLVVRTRDLLPPPDTLSTKVRHASLHLNESGRNSLPMFDIAAAPASRLESSLLPRLRTERKIGDASQPLHLMLERQLRFSDINLPALALAGMASILSFAMLLIFLRSHDRQRRTFDEGRRAIEHMALHDTLTRLPNRFLMLGHLEQAISLALRHGMKVAVLFLDLDGFKPINDRLGHPAGDLVLQEVARRLQTCVRDCDTASRYGGDEFVILLTEIWGEGNAALVANKVLEAIMQPIQVYAESVHISTSIGIAIFPDHGRSAKTLIEEADKAMYVAKQNGAGQFVFSGVAPAGDSAPDAEAAGQAPHSGAASSFC